MAMMSNDMLLESIEKSMFLYLIRSVFVSMNFVDIMFLPPKVLLSTMLLP